MYKGVYNVGPLGVVDQSPESPHSIGFADESPAQEKDYDILPSILDLLSEHY